MAISKSRLGRGLGNLIAGGISSSAKPSKPAAKPAAPQKTAPAAKPAATKGKAAPAKSPAKSVATKAKPSAAKPAAKPTPAKPAPSKQAPAKPAPTKGKPPVKQPAAKASSASKPTPAAIPATATATPAAAAAKNVAPRQPSQPVTASATATAAAPREQAAAAQRASVAAVGSSGASDVQRTQNAELSRPAATAPAATPAAATSVADASATGTAAPNTAGHGTTTHSTAAAAHTSAGAQATPPAAQPAASAVAQAAAAVQPTASSPYREILVSSVVPNPYQPRRDMDPEHIADLANSIASEGLLQPIVVRPLEGGKSYELIAGERRWRAHQKLGLRTIAARVMDASDSSSAVISLIENIQRQALNPIEEALGFASLMRDFDLTQEAVSERIGRARASIANALRLLSLDREIQGYVAKGMLSVGHAKILLGLEEPAQRVVVARRIIEAGMSVREAEELVRRLKNEKHTRISPIGGTALSEADRTAITDLEKQLSSRLNTKVHLKHTPKKGRIVIEYYGNEDLQRILERTGLQL